MLLKAAHFKLGSRVYFSALSVKSTTDLSATGTNQAFVEGKSLISKKRQTISKLCFPGQLIFTVLRTCSFFREKNPFL